MARLIPISELVQQRSYDLGQDTHDPTGSTAYAADGERVGTVQGALTEEGGRLRYLIVDAGGWFSSKQVLVPVGLARIEDGAVHFDSLTREQVRGLTAYEAGREYTTGEQVSDEAVLRGSSSTGTASLSGQGAEASYNYRDDEEGSLFRTPTRLQLLEERLLVNKERYVAGQLEVGKRVVTRREAVDVPLVREEVIVERFLIPDAQPVTDVVLGADTRVIRVELNAERAQVAKEAYVAEEVEIGKRTVTEQQTVTGTVGREVLDVTKTGDVIVEGSAPLAETGTSGGQTVTADALRDAAGPLDGKTDRR